MQRWVASYCRRALVAQLRGLSICGYPLTFDASQSRHWSWTVASWTTPGGWTLVMVVYRESDSTAIGVLTHRPDGERERAERVERSWWRGSEVDCWGRPRIETIVIRVVGDATWGEVSTWWGTVACVEGEVEDEEGQ